MANEKVTVAFSSMAASATMAIGKLVVGLMTGSLGLLSEALHSFLDFGATVMTYMAVRVSDGPADEKHPYGHGKIESIAALGETALLFLTALWVVYEAVHRLISGKIEVEATWASIAVLLASIVIDISRARALSRVAKKTNSQALAADALHFSSDVYGSVVVLIGLGFVAVGWPMGDPIAAIGVAFFICHAGWKMGKSTIDVLIDAVPAGVTARIEDIVAGVDGVAKVCRIRARPAGAVMFVDIELAVARSCSLVQVGQICERIREILKNEIPEAEVSISTQPLAMDTETVQERVAAISGMLGVNVHHVSAHSSNGALSISLDLEVDGLLSIQQAHDIASALEDAVRKEFGETAEVDTHIEPLLKKGLEGNLVSSEDFEAISASLKKLIGENGDFDNVHNVRIHNTENGIIVIFHCEADAKKTLIDVHKSIDAIEHKLQVLYENIWKITAHVEPRR